jgi:methylated-DNA-[protein]-cysteine S-methyltransferase
VGGLWLVASEAGLTEVRFLGLEEPVEPGPGAPPRAAERHVEAALRWLDEYFENPGAPPRAPLPPLAPVGTPFQRRVWEALATIQYGTTATYGDLCRLVDRPRAARAVGQANGRNPLCIVVPCHRVIATGGKLGGYSSGLERKRWLLRHEGWNRPGVLDDDDDGSGVDLGLEGQLSLFEP